MAVRADCCACSLPNQSAIRRSDLTTTGPHDFGAAAGIIPCGDADVGDTSSGWQITGGHVSSAFATCPGRHKRDAASGHGAQDLSCAAAPHVTVPGRFGSGESLEKE